MSVIPYIEYAPFPPVEKRSIRNFVEDQEVGWKPIGNHRLTEVKNGKHRVPKWSGKIMRLAYTCVELAGRKVVALNDVRITFCKVNDDGFADQEFQRENTAKYANIDVRPIDHPQTYPTVDDVEAIKRCLGLAGE